MKHFDGKTVAIPRLAGYSEKQEAVVTRNRTLFAGILWTAVVFGAAVAARAQLPASTAPGMPVTAPQTAAAPTTTALGQEALGWLADLIKINTTNPPGNEEAAAKYIAAILQKEGIAAEILPISPGRSAVVARLKSAALADPSRALLLVAHMDVVGADKSKWTVDPFAAVMKDGYLYGRGAVDDKGMLAANLAAFLWMKRNNARLNRDVIFLATCDEEAFGESSIKALIAKNWDKFAAGFAINEGGIVLVKDGKVQYTGVQASEKVTVNVDVVARGTSGHASIPRKDNAVVHLATALEKIGNYNAPVHLTAVVRRYFEGIAPLQDDEIAKWIRSLDTADRGEHAAKVISDANPVWSAMMRDTISPTMLSAGIRANVIPAEARATLNIRLLPGNTIDVLLAELSKLVHDPQVKLEIQQNAALAAPTSSLETDFYTAIVKSAAQEFGGAPVLPYQSTWGTDSAQLRLHNVQAYGLVPFPLSDEDLKRMHGEDERIPVAAFAKGVDLMVKIVDEFAVAK
jgi:acetylornithine deacetylase/succinyl-diaminopimelate desuccinylase-like protein